MINNTSVLVLDIIIKCKYITVINVMIVVMCPNKVLRDHIIISLCMLYR